MRSYFPVGAGAILITSLLLVLSGCVQYYDATHKREWTGGSFISHSNRSTSVSVATYNCCPDKMSAIQVNDEYPGLNYPTMIYSDLGELALILEASERGWEKKPAKYYVTFDFTATQPMELHLNGSKESGFYLADKEGRLTVHGQVYEKQDLYKAYAELGFSPDQRDGPVAEHDTIYSLDETPRPVFQVRPSYMEFVTSVVVLGFDLDVHGRPINIKILEGESYAHSPETSVHLLSLMRFQRTSLNDKYVPRKNLRHTFRYDLRYVY